MSLFFEADRALAVRGPAIPLIAGAPALVPLKLQGREGVNGLFEYRLILQTPDAYNFRAGEGANLDLDAFVGRELTCAIELEGHGSFTPGVPGGLGAHQGAGERELSGLVTQARFLGESDRHALYELTLRPWLHLATLTTDCRVFQDRSPVEVIEDVLARYAFACERRLIETYPRVDYTVQYNESDFEFVTRLMQAWGINYHFEHSGGVHRLVWSDHNGAFQVTQGDQGKGLSAYHRIPFHPLGHKIDREYIHGFSPTDGLTSGSYASRDYDHTRPRATLEVRAESPRPTGHAHQAVYLWRGDRAGLGGSDYSQPNRGADKAAHRTEAQGEHLARLRMQVLRQSGRRATGVGHLRGIVAGCTFALTGHPREQANAEYITLETRFVIENVGEDAQRAAQVTGLTALSDAQRLSGQWRVAVEFDVQPTTEALRPEAVQRKPKTGGPETAVVVGPDAGTAETNIYTDALGRIKVQFPWDRHGQKNQNSSCWVRVASAWAGNQLGAMHVPRVGQEVIVGFLGGDPDLPIVTGRVYNQLNPPPWALPAQQALSGFRSRELTPGGGNASGGRSNHLILDDTAEKIQAQLKSDHQSSSLSLGHITRVEDNAGRKDARGEGFELRTDGHGVVRAKDGFPAFRGWNCFDDDLSPTDQRCDSLHLKTLIRNPDPADDRRMEREQLALRLGEPVVRARLRRAICRFPSEWDQRTVVERYNWLLTEYFEPADDDPTGSQKWERFVNHARAISFTNLPADFLKADWRFHPREFVGVMRTCGWLSRKESQHAFPNAKLENINRFSLDLNKLSRKYLGHSMCRRSHFIGQMAHESGQLGRALLEGGNTKGSRNFEDLGDYYRGPDNYFNQYENNISLGNVSPGDGIKFRGRGAIQLTGLYNYVQYWVYRGWITKNTFDDPWWDKAGRRIPKINDPQRVSARQGNDQYDTLDSSLSYWVRRSINRPADAGMNQNDIELVTLRINSAGLHLHERVVQSTATYRYLGDDA